jgi:L-lactate permease
MWTQVYNPLHNIVLSALLAAVPVVVLLGTLGFFHLKAHVAALLGLAASLTISIFEFGMPVQMSVMSAVYGAAYGLMPIGWIILNVIFLYQLTLQKGHFKVLQNSIANVTEDRRLQLLLIAFAFGAFFEGAAGFGTPVAVTGAILIGIGFSPLAASGLCLIANTAPVAFGAIGTPVIALSAVTGLDLLQLSKQVGHQLPFFSVIIPFWLIWAFAGFRGMIQIWPAILGLAFAQTGALYPMFGTLLGWLGVALTGSDTSSNVLFGGLQKITAQQLGLSPVLMAAANSSGGVMGKRIDAQSIVVASTATRWYGHEGEILRFVFFHSIPLAVLVGLLVTIQAHL